MRLCAWVAVLWLGVAGAAPKADPVAAATELMGEAEFDKALALLDSALRSAKQPTDIAKIQLLRGQVLVALGKSDDAVNAFAAALGAKPDSDLDTATASPDALGAMAKAKRSITSELSIAIAGGVKANIRLDDTDLGPAPMKTKVGAGKHRLEALLATGEKVTKDIEVLPARPLAVTIEPPLASASLPPPPPPPPAAEPSKTEPAPASATSVNRPAPSRGGSKVGLIPIAIGVALIGTGVGCIVMAYGNHDQLTAKTGKVLTATEEANLVSMGGAFQTLGWVAIGVGAAAGVAGGAMLLFMSGSGSGGGETGGLRLTVSPTLNGGYVGLTGSF